ncbi:MAG: hypothetical protein RML57_03510 [Acidobacteriota bacterium]|nr:hypothetical protein [Acidobacteriota bacterium]
MELPPKPTTASAEAWIQGEFDAPTNDSTASMSRLTLDLPTWLHRAIKADCAQRGVKMAEELRRLLIERYGPTGRQRTGRRG